MLRNFRVGEIYLVCETVGQFAKLLKNLSVTCDSLCCFAALLLQAFVQNHSANQPHTTRHKHAADSKLSRFTALRPCELTACPPALP